MDRLGFPIGLNNKDLYSLCLGQRNSDRSCGLVCTTGWGDPFQNMGGRCTVGSGRPEFDGGGVPAWPWP